MISWHVRVFLAFVFHNRFVRPIIILLGAGRCAIIDNEEQPAQCLHQTVYLIDLNYKEQSFVIQ